MAEFDPIAMSIAIAKAQEQEPSVLSKMWSAVTGEGSDPTIPSAIDANLGLSASKSAQMSALFATTRSPDRLKSGMLKVEPTAEFTEDDTGRLVALWPIRREGELTGQVTRFYPNEPGLGFTEALQASGVVAAAGPIGKALKMIGLPTAGYTGAATVGATEAALVEGASSQLTDAPFQVSDIPIGAVGSTAGQKLFNMVGSLVIAIRRSGPERVLGPDGKLLPGPAQMARDAGLDPEEVSASVAAEMQKQVRRGIEPEAAGVSAMSTGLPVEVPMTQGAMSGSKGQQLVENQMESGVYGGAAERAMGTFREGQQGALRENIDVITEQMVPESFGGQVIDPVTYRSPVTKQGGGKMAQETLVARRAFEAQRAKGLYTQARASGSAVVEPEEALNIADTARAVFREDFNPNTAPKVDEFLLELDEIMANGGDIPALQAWRQQLNSLRKGVPTVDGAAAGAIIRSVDGSLMDAVDNQLIIGDQAAVKAWRNAITNYAEYAKRWKDGGMLKLLTDKAGRDGEMVLKVSPEDAANAIFTATASGMAKRTNLARDLSTLRSELPLSDWNSLRQSAFIRLTDMAEGASKGGDQQVSGVKFKKAWENLKKESPAVANVLFNKAERDMITQFGNVAAKATNTAVNASNSANAAAGMIQRLAAAFTSSGPGQFIIQNYLSGILREPYGALKATRATAAALAPRQLVPNPQEGFVGAIQGAVSTSPRGAAVGAGAGAALSQEESISSNIPLIGGRMTVGGQ